jgi:hypothetical protein
MPPDNNPKDRSWIELTGIRAAKILGSLQLAVTLLILFAGAVVLGTLTESAYTQKIAQELVYRSWWFVFLLFMLSVNIFFAAAKKWPWKKHQTGFVITHIGLITMLVGGILNGIGGTDATIALVDTNDLSLLKPIRSAYGLVPQASSHYAYNDIYEINIVAKASKNRQVDFEGGPLPWHAGTDLRVGRDPWLVILSALQNPFGRGWSVDLDSGDRLEAINYLPSARFEPYSPAPINREAFPALKVQLRTPRMPNPMEHWLAFEIGKQWPKQSRMPVLTQFLGACPEGLLPEFFTPPSAKELGAKGVLVIRAGGRNHRLDVNALLKEAKWVEVGQGMQVKINSYEDGPGGKDGTAYPAVEVECKQGGMQGKFKVFARFAGKVIDVNAKEFVEQKMGSPWLFWLHPSDMHWGDDQLRGVLDFVLGGDGKLYYRDFANRDRDGKAEFVCESSGQAEVDRDYPIWSKMLFRFRVTDFLPRAVEQDRYVPIDAVPGKETDADKIQATPAIQFRLSDRTGKKQQDFWVGMGREEMAQVGTSQYRVRFGQKQRPLGFEIKLERAEQTVDPGTRAAATFTSFVEISDPSNGIKGKKEEITMNKPLEYGGYTFYQSNYTRTAFNDALGRPVSISGFTVSNDPGIGLKYLGSCFLILGITCMFYMKAYFITGRRRLAPATDSGPPPAEGPTKENDL